MTKSYLKHLGVLNEMRSERYFVNNNTALIRLLIEGFGYGVLTNEVAQPFLEDKELIPLHSGGITNDLALAWYPRPEMPNYFKALIKAIN